jgi:hypothetical protein
MKVLVTLIITLLSANIYAERIACTTRFLNMKTSGNPNVKICGAVTLEKAFDNGVKYRKKPRFCNKFVVDFFSIRKGDQPKFTVYCDKIFKKNCYMVRIRDDASRQGMGHLSSHIVFSSIKTMPTIFNLNASGVGHKKGMPGPGRLVRMDLSCRKTQ